MESSRSVRPAFDPTARLLDAVLAETTLEGALALGVRFLAELSEAEVAAILPTQGGDPAIEAWHPDDPVVRERHRADFITAIEASAGQMGHTREGAAVLRILPLVAAGQDIGSVCLMGGAPSCPGVPAPDLGRLRGVLAALAAARHEVSRSESTRREYERWFRTLDEQVRVLERERQKFAAFVHRSDAEVFVTDREGIIRWTNALLASQPPAEAAESGWTGRPCSAVCSRNAAPGTPPECGDCPVVRALTLNQVVHHEFARGSDSGLRNLYASALPIKGPDGLPHEVLVTVQDLSDLNALRRSESRYRLLFERSARAIIMVEPETGRIVMANRMARQMTGWSAEELCGRTIDTLYPPEDRERVAEHHRTHRWDGSAASVECRILGRDGVELLASVTGTRCELDGQDVDMLELQDITETRRVEEALRKAEERLRSVVANAPVVLFAIDENGIFTLSEGRGLLSLGLTPGQVVGCSVFDLYTDHPEILADIRRAMAGEEFVDQIEVGELHFETWYAPTRGPAGRPHGIIGVANDVSQRWRLEQQLRHSQKMEAIGRLAGGVAHDFNNLLAAILGHGELLMRQLDPSHPHHRYVEGIQKAAARGALLTRQLLAFSRKEVLTPRELDVHLVVAEMEEMLRRLIGSHIELVILLGDRPMPVCADRGQLEQVLMNLAVNARDAMADGGVLTVEVGAIDLDDRVEEGPRRAGPWVTIRVTDTGCGMDPATAGRIFEPFFTTKTLGKGTGLGLSMVYGIVEQSGGWVEVDSAPGTGTVFTVFLPRRDGAASTPAVELPLLAPNGGSETVLLTEDDSAVRAVAREALQSHGYRVIEASNGVEALAAARAHPGPIQLLVTDLTMPQMGGRELADRLLAEFPALRAVFMSGYGDQTSAPQAGAIDPMAFLQKPFTISALARIVRDTLDAVPPGGDVATGRHARAA